MHVGDVGGEALRGVGVGEEADVGKTPAEDWVVSALGNCGRWSIVWFLRWRGETLTVDEEDDGLGLIAVFGLSDVGRQAGDFFFAAFGFALLDLAGEAAGGHAGRGGHGGGCEVG